jgi:hypothetical protein
LQHANIYLTLEYTRAPVDVFGCETWFLTLREEYRLNVFENRVLRRIFGPKMDEVTGGWRKLHNDELRDLYSSPSTIIIIKLRRIRWVGHGGTNGGEERRVQVTGTKSRGRETTRKTKMWVGG